MWYVHVYFWTCPLWTHGNNRLGMTDQAPAKQTRAALRLWRRKSRPAEGTAKELCTHPSLRPQAPLSPSASSDQEHAPGFPRRVPGPHAPCTPHTPREAGQHPWVDSLLTCHPQPLYEPSLLLELGTLARFRHLGVSLHQAVRTILQF